ncbi:MAG: DUF115 domain-containing protein [Spirochaetes bacterium]|nr:DUF115 domain-containing protein [Spirochaetota bacterium]
MRSERIEPIVTKSGDITGVWKGVTLHSRIDPRREAERAVQEGIPQDFDGIVVLGFGLGYHVEVILSRFPRSKVWIVEPDLSLFEAASELRDCSKVLMNPNVRLFLGSDQRIVDQLVQSVEDFRFTLYRYRPSVEFYSEFYKNLERRLHQVRSRRQVNLNTLARFGKLWVRNLSRNLNLLSRYGGIETLNGRFHSFPALVIAAGPSLDDILPHLIRLREKFLLIAVDTSYMSCVRFHVEPDFVVVMDPQYWNTRHLDRAVQKSARLVSEPSTHPTIFRRFPGKTFLAGSLFPLGHYLQERIGKRATLGAGGSVATSAWDFARFLGCNPIVMAGLDLSFPNKRTHCKGSFFEERIFSLRTRLEPEETHFFRYLQEASPLFRPSNNGQAVLTDQRMLVYHDWFEIQGKLHRDTRTLTLSRNGLKIEGVDWVPLEEVLEYPSCRNTVDAILQSIDQEHPVLPDPWRIEEGKHELLRGLATLEELAQEGIRRAELLKTRLSQHLSIDLDQLNEIDENILSHQYRNIAGFLLARTLMSLEQTNPATVEQTLENSLRIYRDLLDSIRFHKEILDTHDPFWKTSQDFALKTDDSNGGSFTTL